MFYNCPFYYFNVSYSKSQSKAGTFTQTLQHCDTVAMGPRILSACRRAAEIKMYRAAARIVCLGFSIKWGVFMRVFLRAFLAGGPLNRMPHGPAFLLNSIGRFIASNLKMRFFRPETHFILFIAGPPMQPPCAMQAFLFLPLCGTARCILQNRGHYILNGTIFRLRRFLHPALRLRLGASLRLALFLLSPRPPRATHLKTAYSNTRRRIGST